MKKIYALITGALLTLATTVEAQTTPRVVLFEEFTGENCNPCAGVNPYMKRFSDLNAQDSFLHLAYQVPIPSAGPIYNIYKTDADARMTYYSVNFAPWGQNDGQNYPVWTSATGNNNVYDYFDSVSVAGFSTTPGAVTPTSPGFNQRRAILSPCAITIVHSYSANYDSVYAMAIVSNTSTYSSLAAGSLKFRIALTEKQLTYPSAPGTNGETEFYNVVRKMYPSSAGTAMANTQTTGTSDTFYVAARIPSYVRDRGQLQFIAWVQDDNSKEVKQAGSSVLKPVTNLVDMIVYGDSAQAITCTNSNSASVPAFVSVKNTGGVNITSLNIGVSVDGAAATNVPWTGSIAPGNVSQISVGPVTLSSGQHRLTFVASNPNGTPLFSSTYDSAKIVASVAGTSMMAPYHQSFEDTSAYPPANCLVQAGPGADIWYPSRVFNGAGNTTFWGAEGTTHSIFYPNYFVKTGLTGDFYMPKQNFTGIAKPAITFWHAGRQFNSNGTLSNDQLEVQASSDCGATWTSVWSKSGTALATVAATTNSTSNTGYFPTATTDWVPDTATLTTFANQDNIWIRFHNTSDFGDNTWIDQINISNIALGINDIDNLSFVSLYPNPAMDNLTVELGTSKAATFEMSIVNTLGQEVKTIFNGDVNVGSHNLEFNIADLPAGIYNLEIRSNNQIGRASCRERV
jgi:hypothetical protein